jgi:hypothetical protein
MTTERGDVLKAVKRLGARGAHFQYPALRAALAVDSDDKNGSSRVHNYLKRLVASGAVEIVAGPRVRNRYYRVKSEEKLREFAPTPASPEPGLPRGGGPDRLARIEVGIQGLSDRLEQIDSKLIELLASWS